MPLRVLQHRRLRIIPFDRTLLPLQLFHLPLQLSHLRLQIIQFDRRHTSLRLQKYHRRLPAMVEQKTFRPILRLQWRLCATWTTPFANVLTRSVQDYVLGPGARRTVRFRLR
uniref:Uncharacterized protein n=1 Tax=Cacopsylla melanoneura TaxID=428564 RepID=A0A8D8SRQ5_9HEMI